MPFSKSVYTLLFSLLLIFTTAAQSTYKSIFSSVGEFSDAALAADGSFIAVGSSGSAEIVKVNVEGELQWSTTLSNNDINFIRAVTLNQNGDIFVLGHINVSGTGSIVVFKLDKDGVFQSSKRLFHSSTNSGWDITADGQNGVFVLGGGCNGDNFILRLDEELEIVWQRGYSVLLAANGHTIERLSNGNFIIGGAATNTSNDTKPFQVFEINPAGELLWSKVFAGYALGRVERIIQLSNGDLAMLYYAKLDPSTGTHIFVTKMTATGDPIWSRILRNEWELARDFAETKEGGLLLVGSHRVVGDGDAMILKLSKDGIVEFIKNVPGELFNSAGQQYLNKILPVCEDKFAVFGFLDGMMAAFINSNGDGFCESSDVGIGEYDLIEHNITEMDEFVIQSPLTFEELDFEVSVKYDFLIENNFCSYDDPDDTSCMTSSTNNELEKNKFNLSPNPVHDLLIIDFDSFEKYSVQILDHNSKIVTDKIDNAKNIDVSGFPNGIYFVRIVSNKTEQTQRFVKL